MHLGLEFLQVVFKSIILRWDRHIGSLHKQLESQTENLCPKPSELCNRRYASVLKENVRLFLLSIQVSSSRFSTNQARRLQDNSYSDNLVKKSARLPDLLLLTGGRCLQLHLRGEPGWLNELGSWITYQLIQAYHPYGVGSRHGCANDKKGAFDSQSQVKKYTSCLPMVGGSLQVLKLLPSLNLVAKI